MLPSSGLSLVRWTKKVPMPTCTLEIPGLESQTVVGEGPGLAADPAQAQEEDGAGALTRSVTGMGTQLRIELVPQPPGQKRVEVD